MEDIGLDPDDGKPPELEYCDLCGGPFTFTDQCECGRYVCIDCSEATPLGAICKICRKEQDDG